jgi:hypothetical protein
VWRVLLSNSLQTLHTAYTSALRTTARQQTGYREPYAAIHGLVLLMMGENAQNMSRKRNINKLHLLHQVGLIHYFIIRMHGQMNLKLTIFLRSFYDALSVVRVI